MSIPMRDAGGDDQNAEIERREHPRRAARPGIVFLQAVPSGPKVRVKLVDVSIAGACLIVPTMVTVGQKAQVEFTDGLGTNLLTADVVVQWSAGYHDGRWETGCLFQRRLSKEQFLKLIL